MHEIPARAVALVAPGQRQRDAELVAFLASDRASHVTGASIPIAGGLFF